MLRTTIVLMLVAIWLPASSHALLERAGLIHDAHAHDVQESDHHSADPHQHHFHNHDLADGLCQIQLSQIRLLAPTAFSWCSDGCLFDSAWLGEASQSSHQSGISAPGAAPPELSHRWQFSFRTALPARAPSPIS